MNSVDGVAPVLLSATTADDDSDGRIDGVAASLLGERPARRGGRQQSSFALAGYQVTGAGAADGTDVSLGLVEGGCRRLRRDDRPSPTPATASRTCATPPGNVDAELLARAGGRRRAPGAAVGRRRRDVDDDGRIDRLDSTWSEPLVHADDSSAPFAVSASGFSVARVRAAAGDDLAIDLAEPAGVRHRLEA